MFDFRIELDLRERNPNHVTHYGYESRGDASQVQGFRKGLERLILDSGDRLKVLLTEGRPADANRVVGDGGRTTPVTLADFQDELPELVAPKSREGGDFSYHELRSSLSSVLEKILLLSKLETDETMNELAIQRIEIVKADLQRTHDEMAAKIRKNLEAMKKAAKSKTLMSIFGWIMAVALVVATIVTGGVALGAALVATITGLSTGISVGAVQMVALAASAAVTLTMQILDETGTMERLQKKLAENFKKKGLSNADLRAQLALQLPMMILMMGGGIAGTGAIGAVLKNLPKTILYSVVGMGLAMSLGTAAQQGVTIYSQYRAAMAAADVSEVQAMVQLIQQMLDEVQEELQEILEKIQDLIGRMFEIIASALDAQKEIAKQVGLMA